MRSVSVIGAGAWGTALAQAAAMAGRAVRLHGRDPSAIHEINSARTNRQYLGDVLLSNDLVGVMGSDGVEASDMVLLAVPAQSSRQALAEFPPGSLAGKPVVLCAKGLERGTLLRQSEILRELAPEAIPFVLSGPSFAVDVAAGRPTAVTLAGDDAGETSALAAALAGPGLRPYAADDRIGVELAGALKNVYALACGAVEGAGLGASARAALLARGYAEMARLVVAMGGSATTLTGLAGLGDLTLSCTSPQSRNYSFGVALGAGVQTSAATLVEGVMTAPVAEALAARFGVEAPLVRAVNQVLEGQASIEAIVTGLMSRPLKRED